MTRHRGRSRRVAGPVALAAAMVAVGTGAAAATSPGLASTAATCPALMVLNVEGTTETSPAADPDLTTGTLSSTAATAAATGHDIQTRSIPYEASFGAAPGTGPGTAPFAASATDAVSRLNSTAAQVVSQCPHTQLAVAGYSQGAVVVRQWAQQVSANGNAGPVPADRVAGLALLSDATRPAGSQAFPNAPGHALPAAPQGGTEAATSQITAAPMPGGGISANPKFGDLGDLDKVTKEWCAPGDLACNAPPHAAALRTAAGIAASADLRNPVTAVTSINGAWQHAVTTATTTAALDDVQIHGNDVDYAPAETLSDRLAEAADPRTPVPGPAQVQAANDKIGRAVAAVAADPLRQIPKLAGQVAAAVSANLAANADLSPQTIGTYLGTVGAHESYGRPGGAAEQAGAWFADLSRGIGGGR